MNNQVDTPVAPAKHLRMNYVLYPHYKKLHEDFTPCLLDADFQWYKNSGAESFFNKWRETPFNVNFTRGHFFDPGGGNLPNGGELLAYYVPVSWARLPSPPSQADKAQAPENPATLIEENFYGIHFIRKKMIQAAKQALGITAVDDLGVLSGIDEQDRWIPYCVFFQNILAHEFCHAWVEDLVCFVDTTKYCYGQGDVRQQAIRNEEALCDTIAYAWMCNFIETTPLNENQKDNLRERFREWMREGLPGYKNFSEQNELPLKSKKLLFSKEGLPAENLDPNQEGFQIGFIPLLRDVFGIRYYKRENPIPTYFNYDLTAEKSNLGSDLPRPGSPQYAATMPENRYWRGNRVPIYWHA